MYGAAPALLPKPVLIERSCLHRNNPLLDPSDDLIKLGAVLDQVKNQFLRVFV